MLRILVCLQFYLRDFVRLVLINPCNVYHNLKTDDNIFFIFKMIQGLYNIFGGKFMFLFPMCPYSSRDLEKKGSCMSKRNPTNRSLLLCDVKIRTVEYLRNTTCSIKVENLLVKHAYFWLTRPLCPRILFPSYLEFPTSDSRKCRVTWEKTSGTYCIIFNVFQNTLF
jgi:hypothetical protein